MSDLDTGNYQYDDLWLTAEKSLWFERSSEVRFGLDFEAGKMRSDPFGRNSGLASDPY